MERVVLRFASSGGAALAPEVPEPAELERAAGERPYLTSQRGSAVLVDGRWKVSRATFAGLMARVGVTVPGT